MDNAIKRFYAKWYLLLLWIILLSAIIGLAFSLVYDKELSFTGILLPSIYNTVVLWAGNMLIVMYVWRKFPWEFHPVKHLLVEISLICLFLTAFIFTVNYFYISASGMCFADGLSSNIPDIVFTIFITFLIVTIHEAVFFYRQWKFHFSKSIKLEKDNLEAQYNALKSQVNPHFLFNSLNSLMSLLEGNPKAEQYVQDLSEYLRYVLISNEKTEVELSEELEIVQKYLSLQQLRFGDNLKLNVQVSDDVLGYKIPSLVLQMLIENCIKHNIISEKRPLTIRVFNEGATVTVLNNKQLRSNFESTGKGLANISGRIGFYTNEKVKIVDNDTVFSVTIPLLKS